MVGWISNKIYHSVCTYLFLQQIHGLDGRWRRKQQKNDEFGDIWWPVAKSGSIQAAEHPGLCLVFWITSAIKYDCHRMTPYCSTREKYLAVLLLIPVHLSVILLLHIKLLLAKVLSLILLQILFLSELNQHSQKQDYTYSCPNLQRRKDTSLSAARVGDTYLTHISRPDTHQHLVLGKNLA